MNAQSSRKQHQSTHGTELKTCLLSPLGGDATETGNAVSQRPEAQDHQQLSRRRPVESPRVEAAPKCSAAGWEAAFRWRADAKQSELSPGKDPVLRNKKGGRLSHQELSGRGHLGECTTSPDQLLRGTPSLPVTLRALIHPHGLPVVVGSQPLGKEVLSALPRALEPSILLPMWDQHMVTQTSLTQQAQIILPSNPKGPFPFQKTGPSFFYHKSRGYITISPLGLPHSRAR